MTRKLTNSILTICLLFSSLYLPAHANEANKTASSAIKKSPDAYFSDGDACLMKADITCARLALASIPSLSPYAKLLQGAIALHEQRIDAAIQLLLPLQAENSITAATQIRLHEQLAQAFIHLNDAPQAAEHLMQAINISGASNIPTGEKQATHIHQKIWELLNQQEQSELIAMRGNTTDYELQGWIDLRLASKHQDMQASITAWSANYPDHSATALARTLTQKAEAPPAQLSLPLSGAIALIMPLTSEANAASAEAFQQGLQTSLSIHGIPNAIALYTSDVTPESLTEQHTLAKSEGAAYVVAPFISPEPQDASGNIASFSNDLDILKLTPLLNDEARKIAKFAIGHAIQHITIITADNEAAKQMADSFRSAWQAELGTTAENDQTHLITLPSDIQPGNANLLDLKAQLSTFSHDMVLLAMSATEAKIVRPYLNISTPTMAFATAHDAMQQNIALNAVRFVDIPFLLPTNTETFHEYHAANPHHDSNELSRWFALGADTLQLIIALQNRDKETIINGLTGVLTVNKNGNIRRELPIAKFTFDGIELEQ